MTQDEWQIPEIRDFSGGLRLDKSPILLTENEVLALLNATLDERGAAKKRKGYNKASANSIDSTVIGVDSMLRVNFEAGAKTVVVGLTAGDTKLFDFDGTNFTEITGGSALSASFRVRLLEYNGYLLIYNSSVFQAWSGSGAKADVVQSDVNVVPEVLAVSDGKLFATDSSLLTNRVVYFSIVAGWATDPFTDMTFTAGHSLDIPSRVVGPNGIVSLFQYGDGDNLLIQSETATYRLLGEGALEYYMEQISRVAGAVSPDGIAETKDGAVVWVGVNQVYALFRNAITAIGDAVSPLFSGVDMTDCDAIYHPDLNSVLFQYRDGVLVWNAVTQNIAGGWSIWDVPMYVATRYSGSTDFNKMVFCKRDSNFVYEINTGTDDDGADIDFSLITREIDFERFMAATDHRQVWVLCETDQDEPMTVSVAVSSKDDGITSTPDTVAIAKHTGADWDDFDWDDGTLWVETMTKIAVADIKSGMVGQLYKISLNSSDKHDLKILGIGTQVKSLNRM